MPVTEQIHSEMTFSKKNVQRHAANVNTGCAEKFDTNVSCKWCQMTWLTLSLNENEQKHESLVTAETLLQTGQKIINLKASSEGDQRSVKSGNVTKCVRELTKTLACQGKMLSGKPFVVNFNLNQYYLVAS